METFQISKSFHSQEQAPKDQNPCFYGDTSDKTIYDGGQRGGYWGEAFSIRDAEKGKGTDVVDITKVAADLTTNGDGVVSQPGLANGTYYLVETKTKEGYNLLKEPAAVTLSISYKTTWDETNTYDASGNLVKHEVSKTNETFNSVVDSTGAGYATTIVNKKGFKLPTTGGIGTLMFFIIGGVLIAGGICLITVPNKKRSV